MQENYNDIILQKPLRDFYFAYIDEKIEIDDEQLERIISGENIIYQNISNDTLYKYETILKEKTNLYIDGKISKEELVDFVSGCYEQRYITILTMINDSLYDMCLNMFLDLNNCRVVNYVQVTDLYDNEMAKKSIKKGNVWIDFINLEQYQEFTKDYLEPYDEDLTQDLINEMTGKVLVYHVHDN